MRCLPLRRLIRTHVRRLVAFGSDDGMSTAEYAVGTIAAVAFAAVLYGVITGSPVVAALTNLIQRALSVRN